MELRSGGEGQSWERAENNKLAQSDFVLCSSLRMGEKTEVGWVGFYISKKKITNLGIGMSRNASLSISQKEAKRWWGRLGT